MNNEKFHKQDIRFFIYIVGGIPCGCLVLLVICILNKELTPSGETMMMSVP
jgi:hypothetical protein